MQDPDYVDPIEWQEKRKTILSSKASTPEAPKEPVEEPPQHNWQFLRYFLILPLIFAILWGFIAMGLEGWADHHGGTGFSWTGDVFPYVFISGGIYGIYRIFRK